MNFYTNIQMIGNQFLVRGYEDGKRVQYRDDNYRPTCMESKHLRVQNTRNMLTLFNLEQ